MFHIFPRFLSLHVPLIVCADDNAVPLCSGKLRGVLFIQGSLPVPR